MNDELKARLAGRRVVASVSGGKDSAAMCLWLRKMGIPYTAVHLLTGWDSDVTMEYLRGPLTAAIGPIVEIRGKLLMEELIERKAMFPSRVRRFCTQELKVFPMQRYLNALVDAGEDVVNAVGIRRAESKARSTMKEWEWSEGFDCEVWRPLISWTEQAVIDIHAEFGLRPNPLYLLGAERVGCWPCIFARKSEIKLIADTDPARIDRIRELEAQIAVGARARFELDRQEHPDKEPVQPHHSEGHEANEEWWFRHCQWRKTGERLRNPFGGPSWFQASTRNKDGKRPCTPIDEVVKWARGGDRAKQVEMFEAAPGDTGCMRWGLCETHGKVGT